MLVAPIIGKPALFLAEALALRNGLLLPIENNILHTSIEGDNLLIIQFLHKRAQCSWKIQLLMDDVKNRLTHFDSYTARHIYREANRTPDYIQPMFMIFQTVFQPMFMIFRPSDI